MNSNSIVSHATLIIISCVLVNLQSFVISRYRIENLALGNVEFLAATGLNQGWGKSKLENRNSRGKHEREKIVRRGRRLPPPPFIYPLTF